MSLRYSAGTGFFYDTGVHAEIPDDAVYIAPSRHRELMEAQADGVAIVPGDSGAPIMARDRARTDEEKRAALTAVVKSEAHRRIDRVSPIWRQLNDSREPGVDGARRFARIDRIRAASNALDATIAGGHGDALDAIDPLSDDHWNGNA